MQCPAINSTDIGPINVVPLNPTLNRTYEVLQDVLAVVFDHFPEHYLHTGGDEVQFACWMADDGIRAWMQAHNMSDPAELQVYFQQRLSTLLSGAGKTAIVWDEVYSTLGPQGAQKSFGYKAAVQVWDNSTLLQAALDDGFDGIFSGGWYLDRQQPVEQDATHWFWLDTWADMYNVSLPSPSPSPARRATRAGQQGRMLGGEACMWGEQVADTSFTARVWPRAAGVAERLWSPASTRDAFLAAQRLGVHRCRLAARGMRVGPIWADYCSHDTEPAFAGTDALRRSAADAPVNLKSGELIALLVFIYALGLVSVYLSVCCCHCRLPGLTPATAPSSAPAQRRDKSDPALPDNAGSVQDESMVPLLGQAKATAARGDAAALPSARSGAETPADGKPSAGVPLRERLSSLDVFRGFTVALMVFVDDTGAAFPEIDHTPWDGIRLADFVMPFFDFIVGVSLAMSFKKFDLEAQGAQRWPALRKATVRFVKLFLIGVFTQGGIDFLTYDMAHIRVMGILQRVALCYYAVALMEIFLPRLKTPRDYDHSSRAGEILGDILHMFRRYWWHWLTALVLFLLHTAILYGVDVPPAYGEACGRGQLTPPCNAATYIDKHIFTVAHMYFPANGGSPADADVTYQRLPQCSTCSPGKCRPPEDAPAWCLHGPFDPEGLVSSLNAIITTVIGIHYGHVLRRVKQPQLRMWHWGSFGLVQIVLGLVLHYSGVVMNTGEAGVGKGRRVGSSVAVSVARSTTHPSNPCSHPFPLPSYPQPLSFSPNPHPRPTSDLYSISYTLVSGGAAGLLLTFCFYLVDIKRRGALLWRGFMYLGMNAITMYLCAEGGIIEWTLSRFWLGDKDKNLMNILYPTGVYWGDDDDKVRDAPSHNYQVHRQALPACARAATAVAVRSRHPCPCPTGHALDHCLYWSLDAGGKVDVPAKNIH